MDIDPDAPVVFHPHIVTCRTSGCENEGISLEVLCTSISPTVVCGPCAEQITDVVLTEGATQ